MDMTIRTKGSLCTGVGGLDAAVPGELAWVSETNEQAASILKREHPEVPNLGDITAPGLAPSSIDLLTSGDPCQSMSAAGRQLASDDERFLWPYVMDAIDGLRPRTLFLENVQNLTSVPLVKGGEKGSVLKLRLDDLREAGYAVRWTVLGACAVGAPHHRHRWFLRAEYVGPGAPEAMRVVSKCGAPRTGGRILLPTPTTSNSHGNHRNGRGELPLPGVAALLPTPNARDGGQRGTPTHEHAMRRVENPERSVNLEDAAMAYLLPTSRATDGTNGGPNQRGSSGDLAMGSARQPEHWGKYAPAIALWEQITGMPAPEPTEQAPKGGRRLNPELSEWMMGYPRGYLTRDLSRNDALRCAGNGVVTLQARAAWDLLA